MGILYHLTERVKSKGRKGNCLKSLLGRVAFYCLLDTEISLQFSDPEDTVGVPEAVVSSHQVKCARRHNYGGGVLIYICW